MASSFSGVYDSMKPAGTKQCRPVESFRNDLERMNLNGSIDTLIEFRFRVYQNELDLINPITFGPGSEVDSGIFFRFNSDGFITEQKILDKRRSVKQTIWFFYDHQNTLFRKEYICPDHRLVQTDSLVSLKNRQILIYTKRPGSAYRKQVLQSFDQSGNLCSEDYFRNGFPDGSVFYEYNAEDKSCAMTYLDKDGNFISSLTMFFNEQGVVLRESLVFTEEKMNGRSSGYFSMSTTPVGVDYKNGLATGLITYEYCYDEQQNWIKRMEYDDGQLCWVTTRQIHYSIP